MEGIGMTESKGKRGAVRVGLAFVPADKVRASVEAIRSIVFTTHKYGKAA